MRRNTLYIIFSIITILFLFITAATCSFCGRQLGTAPSDETKIDVEEDETVSENTEEDKETVQDTNTVQSEDEDQDNTAPTISLAISEGPVHSAADDVCWWRVKATVTGSPTPEITWSTDYSNGSFGNTIAQVNLTRDNPNHVLTATATNSAGSDTDSIDLSWGCDGDSEEEEDGEDAEEDLPVDDFIARNITLLTDRDLCGYIEEGENVDTGSDCFVGDNRNGKQIKAYLSFEISELEEIHILDAQLNLLVVNIIANPKSISTSLNIKAYNYENSLDLGDFAVGGTHIHTFDLTGTEIGDVLSITDNDNLKSTLQDSINNRRTWYQLKLGLLGTTNNNSGYDVFEFIPDSRISLIINYSE